MKQTTFVRLLATTASVLVAPIAADFPYNPTTVLYSGDGARVYAFTSAFSGSGNFELIALDVNHTLGSGNIPYVTVSSSLPFLEDGEAAFIPVIDGGGNIMVYTGSCDSDTNKQRLWILEAEALNRSREVTWKEESFAVQDAVPDDDNSLIPRYLAVGFGYGNETGGVNSRVYIFGGMCPAPDTSEDNWLQGDYSNNMLKFASESSHAIGSEYELSMMAARGPPIPEAGCTITALRPTFLNSSEDSTGMQQDFVILGGHTETAFINTSQVALFSVPQESWTFVDVDQPSAAKTELSRRDDPVEVEPRSGHTAVLSPDGERIVMFGGWVGDLNTPAEPQLAVLEVGEGFGGNGPWQWSTTPVADIPFPSAAGIHGHGAAMLPGGIMMVVGGFLIPPLEETARSAEAQELNQETLFFNISSSTWVNEYIPPLVEQDDSSQSNSGPLSTTSQKVGLGAGLVVGISALAFLLLFCCRNSKRSRSQRHMREKTIRDLALGAHVYQPGHFQQGNPEGAGNYFPQQQLEDGSYLDWNRNLAQPNASRGWRSRSGREVERTGLLVEVPSPTRGLRRSAQAKAHYQPGSRYSELRTGKGSGNIPPIDEQEEDDEERRIDGLQGDVHETDQIVRPGSPIVDPFLDPNPLGSHPVDITDQLLFRGRSNSPSHLQNTESRAQEGHEWTISHVEPEMIQRSHSKSARTASDLSDRSLWSSLSYRDSGTGSDSGNVSLLRTLSTRSQAVVSRLSNPFLSTLPSPAEEVPSDVGPSGYESVSARRYSFTPSRRDSVKGKDPDTFVTAEPSFARLQSEGQALLAGSQNGRQSRTESFVTAYDTVDPQKATASDSSRFSWVQSVRRVLTRSASGAGSIHPKPMFAENLQSRTYMDEEISTIDYASSSVPRRAASEGGLWRGKRGPRDWASDTNTWHYRSGDDWGSPEDRAGREGNSGGNSSPDGMVEDGYDENEDWDVETAAEGRVVQVTFTVPKTRLRVVNADPDGNSLVSHEERRESGGTEQEKKGSMR